MKDKSKGLHYGDTATGKNKTPMANGGTYGDTAKHKGKKPPMSPAGGYHT